MEFYVEPYRREVSEKKAGSRSSAIYKEIHKMCPDLIFELCPAHSWAERYTQGEVELDSDLLTMMTMTLSKMIGIPFNAYLPERERDIVFTTGRRRKRLSPTYQDIYHFLGFVRDLIKEDPEQFYALRMYAKL